MSSVHPGLEGSCLCGGVTYHSAGAQIAALCHCRDCQKQTGSTFSAIAGVPAQSLSVRGPLASFATAGIDGGRVDRFFCPTCGSPIYSVVESTPAIVWLKTGTIDGDAPRPQLQLWTSTAQPWAAEAVTIEPRLPTNPPGR